MKVIAECGSGWLPGKYPLEDAIHAALDCGADLVKIQFWTSGKMLAMRRGGAKGLEQWELKARYVRDLAEKLFVEYKRPVLGVSAFHPDDVVALARSTFGGEKFKLAFLKSASQEYQYAALAEAMGSFSATEEVPLLVSIPPTGCLAVSNYHSPAPITWMACVPHYPANAEDYAISRIGAMLDTLPGKTGLSDHTPDLSLLQKFSDHFGSLAVVEKHLLFHEDLRGNVPDGGPWSLSQADFKKYVEVAHGT